MARTRKPRKTPPALPRVDVQVPDWPALAKARRRADVARSTTGRLATLAGAGAAAAGLFTGDMTAPALLATGAATGAGLAMLRLWKPGGLQKATASVLYMLPGAGLATLLASQYVTPNMHPVATPVEAALLAVWTTATWVARPARVGRRMLCPPPPRLPAVAEPAQQEGTHPAARWWAHTGITEGTTLEEVERTGERAMRAVIRSTVPGKPVPDIPKKQLSALLDVPEDDISVGPVPGRGAGYRLLEVGKPDEERDAAVIFDQRIAPVAMPGAKLTGIRTGRPAVAETEEGT